MTLRGKLKEVIGTAVETFVQTKGGLLVPPTVVAGKHFGGFDGYAPWVQQCVVTACKHVRPGGEGWAGVQAEEMNELTAVCMWEPPAASPPVGVESRERGRIDYATVHPAIGKHDDMLLNLERYAEAIAAPTDGLEGGFLAQVARAHAARERGALLVVALNTTAFAATGKINASVSSWAPASVEEALATPAQQYGRKYG